MILGINSDIFLTSILSMCLIMIIRYFLISGALYWVLWIKKVKTAKRLIHREPKPEWIKSDIIWSIASSIIFAVPGAIMIEQFKIGKTEIYQSLSYADFVYIPFSILIYVILHDAYFYWMHRLVHLPAFYKSIHWTHHESRQPTPFTAMAFHFGEAVLEAVFIPLLVYLIPIHLFALVLVLSLMTVFGATNHAGYEIFPQKMMSGWWGKNWITATHHNLHHEKYNCNYGLYFRWWDKIMNTDKMPTL